MSQYKSDDDAHSSHYLDALDRFLEELRREFRANPELAYRVVKALGAEVTFESELAPKLVNLRELVATKGEAGFRKAMEGLTLAQLKGVAKDNNLATTIDMKGLKQDALIDLLYRRAAAKAEERQWKGGGG